jgi:hypothetical protein
VEQFAIVRAEGCSEVQGFFFTKPRLAKGIPERLETKPPSLVSDHHASREMVSMILPKTTPQGLFVNMPGNGNVFHGEAI